MYTESSRSVQELIDSGRIIEAGTLLAVTESSLSVAEKNAYRQEIERRQRKAETLVAQAESLEQTGKNAEAKTVYESVLDEVCDFPGLHENIQRVDDAIALSRAIQRRSKRIRESAAQSEPQGKDKKLIRPFIVIGAVLLTTVSALILFVPSQKNLPASPASVSEKSTTGNPITADRQPSTSSAEVKTGVPEPLVAASNKMNSSSPVTSVSSKQPTATQTETPLQPEEKMIADNSATSVTPPEDERVETTLQKTEAPQDSTTTLPADYYTVQPGDCLSLIAERVLCRQSAWEALYRLNKDQIADPKRLQPGIRLRLTGLESHCTPNNQ
ncbi:MAG: LysM peptidoglycan-binding domain-containing protein [Desulfobulbus sp.]|nr:LysM peptidoglycan-binding domain-containing protein [Desulfobulbus sp.]